MVGVVAGLLLVLVPHLVPLQAQRVQAVVGRVRESARPRKLRSTPYLQREHLRVERQAHAGQLVAFRCSSGAVAAAASFSTTTLHRHQRQRDLERARLLHQALTLEPGAPHRVGARELAPPGAGGGGAEDVGRAVEEVEDALDGA